MIYTIEILHTDTSNIFNVLLDDVIPKGVSPTAKGIFEDKLRGNINYTLTNGTVVVLKHIDEIIGVVLLQPIDDKIYMVHGSVLPKYRNTKASIKLFNYICNELYPNDDLYLTGTNNTFNNFIQPIRGNEYIVTKEARLRLKSISK